MIGVKKNQPSLYKTIETTIANKNKHSSNYITLELNRGRIEIRNTMVSDFIEDISPEWIGLKQIIGVHRVVKEKGKMREEMAYFISSQSSNALLYESGIRSHWQIENSLHWVKDVTLKEDESKIKKGNAPQNISTLKNMSLNIFRKNNYHNIAQAMRLLANDISKLYSIII